MMENAFGLDGQVALVTGGGSGLGFAMARCLTAAGARVIISGRREEVLQEACSKLGALASYIVWDVTATEQALETQRKILLVSRKFWVTRRWACMEMRKILDGQRYIYVETVQNLSREHP